MEKLAFSAINPVIESNIPSAEEVPIRGKEYYSWGEDNNFPAYLTDITENVAAVQAIIRATTDFICGEDIRANFTLPGLPNGVVDKKGTTIDVLVRRLANDYLTLGGFAIQVIRNLQGDIAELCYIDLSGIRTNKKNDTFWYAEEWKWGTKALKIPAFKDEEPNSILLVKDCTSKSVYPKPAFQAALAACETEKAIDNWHLNNIQSGFASNVIISMNNGIPDEVQQEEIERRIQEKFSGSENSGRILIMYNEGKENAATIEKLNDDSVDEKYIQLSKRTKEVIFTSFGISPILLGVQPENNGFAAIEYAEAYKLYNKTRVQPMQKALIRAFETIVGKDAITIEPYQL